MKSEYSFDPLCLELASHFLPNDASERATNDLAQAIQNAVDAHLLRQDGLTLEQSDMAEAVTP